MFVLTTDGMENASRQYDAVRVKRMIEHEKLPQVHSEMQRLHRLS